MYSEWKEVASEDPQGSMLESAVPQIEDNLENEVDTKVTKVADAIKLLREIKLRDENEELSEDLMTPRGCYRKVDSICLGKYKQMCMGKI